MLTLCLQSSNTVGQLGHPHAGLYQPKTEVNPLYIYIQSEFQKEESFKKGKETRLEDKKAGNFLKLRKN